jgi:dynactin complex subunit
MTNKMRLTRNSSNKRKKSLIFKLGNEKMELDTIKGCLSSKAAIISSEKHSFRKDGTKMKMYGRLTTILNGRPRFVISTT